MARSERAVLVRDLSIGTAGVVTALLIASALDGPTAWPRWALAVAFGSVLFPAVDRSTAGVLALTVGVSGGIAALAAVLWWLGPAPLAVLPPLLFGLGVGKAGNRLLFGVVYPLPGARLRREGLA